METRTITQIKIYKLLLNHMAQEPVSVNLIAIAYNKEQLMNWYNSLKVEPYTHGNWNKNFKIGSKLEMYNPMEFSDNCGIQNEWTTKEALDRFMYQAENSNGNAVVPELIPE